MLSSPTFKEELFGTTLRIPGKTFLLGEYGALLGEAALLGATAPQFEIRPTKQRELIGIHPESPAGTLWQRRDLPFGVEFKDPYKGAGGFGASGAQFVAVFALAEFYKSGQRLGPGSWGALLRSYREIVAERDQVLSPSGADLVCQLTGGVCYFDRQNEQVHTLSWPFTDLAFLLFKTAGKVPTHEHVKELSPDQVKGLGQITEKGFNALKRGASQDFVRAVNEMHRALKDRGFVAESSLDSLARLYETDLVAASKGCGALGADVLAIFCAPEHKRALIDKAEKLGLKLVASNQDLSPGLQWELSLRS